MKYSEMTDILLICKGWYDKGKYRNLQDALEAYARRLYMTDNRITKQYIADNILAPVVQAVIGMRPDMFSYIIRDVTPAAVTDGYYDTMYHRMTSLLINTPRGVFDLSPYDAMINDKETEPQYII